MATVRRKSFTPGVERFERRDLPAAVGLGAVADVTDPSAIRVGGTDYVFSSGPGIEVRASSDLTHWNELAPVFPGVPAWALAGVPGATAIWAPDISFFAGTYHLYFAVSTFGSPRSVIGLATNTTLDPTDPAYHWVDQGLVVASQPGRTNFNAIDPNVVVDPSGGVWLTFGSRFGGIKQLRLDPATGKPAAPSTAQSHGPRAASPRGPNPKALASRPNGATVEAPYVFEHAGKYYLFVSFDNCCMGVNSTYKIMVGRSNSPNGPFRDRSGRPLTRGGGTLLLAGEGEWRGPGSNGILSTNGQDWLVFHAYDALNDGVPTLQLRPLTWTPDGWPVVGEPPA